MQRTFLIGDTHFGHKKIIGFEGVARPFATIEEHDEALIANWNGVVGPKDTVWHLGDVLFGSHSFAVLPRLQGIKKLVMGNHDRYPSARYLEHFNMVCGAAELRNCVLTHIPIHESQFRRYRANIHGHLHSRKLPDQRYFCVSAEHIALTPIALDDVIAQLPPLMETGTAVNDE